MDDGIAGGMEIEEVVLDARGPFAAEDNALQKNSNWFETREESKRRVATFGKVFSVFDKIIRRARSAELALYPGKPKGLFIIKKREGKKLSLRCKDSDCTYNLYAKREPDSGEVATISICETAHSCQNAVNLNIAMNAANAGGGDADAGAKLKTRERAGKSYFDASMHHTDEAGSYLGCTHFTEKPSSGSGKAFQQSLNGSLERNITLAASQKLLRAANKNGIEIHLKQYAMLPALVEELRRIDPTGIFFQLLCVHSLKTNTPSTT